MQGGQDVTVNVTVSTSGSFIVGESVSFNVSFVAFYCGSGANYDACDYLYQVSFWRTDILGAAASPHPLLVSSH